MLIFQLRIWSKYVKYMDFVGEGDGRGGRDVSVRFEINPINFKYIVGLK